MTNNFIIIVVIIRNVMALTGFNALIISLMGKLVFKCFQHKENIIWLWQCIPNQTDENIDISGEGAEIKAKARYRNNKKDWGLSKRLEESWNSTPLNSKRICLFVKQISCPFLIYRFPARFCQVPGLTSKGGLGSLLLLKVGHKIAKLKVMHEGTPKNMKCQQSKQLWADQDVTLKLCCPTNCAENLKMKRAKLSMKIGFHLRVISWYENWSLCVDTKANWLVTVLLFQQIAKIAPVESLEPNKMLPHQIGVRCSSISSMSDSWISLIRVVWMTQWVKCLFQTGLNLIWSQSQTFFLCSFCFF